MLWIIVVVWIPAILWITNVQVYILVWFISLNQLPSTKEHIINLPRPQIVVQGMNSNISDTQLCIKGSSTRISMQQLNVKG